MCCTSRHKEKEDETEHQQLANTSSRAVSHIAKIVRAHEEDHYRDYLMREANEVIELFEGKSGLEVFERFSRFVVESTSFIALGKKDEFNEFIREKGSRVGNSLSLHPDA
jgi:hypothetical protein